MDDVSLLRQAVSQFEAPARKMPWAAERVWTADSHVWMEGGMPVVDLHDLGIRLAVSVVEAGCEVAETMQSGAVCFITGRGKHNLSGQSPLRNAVWDVIVDQCDDNGWAARASRPGRLVLITDMARAPASATGRLGPLFWIVALSLAASVAYLCLGVG